MVSTFTPGKSNLEEPAAGDYPDAWAPPVNGNWSVLDRALGGSVVIDMSAGNHSVTTTEMQYLILNLTGSLSGNVTLTLPATRPGFWVVKNDTTGSYNVTVACTSIHTVNAPQGARTMLCSDGSSIFLADDGPYLSRTGGVLSGGITLPTNGLSVGGNQLIVYSGGLYTSGSLTAADVTITSDRRVKSDISEISDALAIVQRLTGVRYTVANGERKIGFIAQDVEPHLPEVVHKDDLGYLSISYSNMAALFNNAIKQMDDKIVALENRILDIEAKG